MPVTAGPDGLLIGDMLVAPERPAQGRDAELTRAWTMKGGLRAAFFVRAGQAANVMAGGVASGAAKGAASGGGNVARGPRLA